MRLLLDTHVLLWMLDDSPRARALAEALALLTRDTLRERFDRDGAESGSPA